MSSLVLTVKSTNLKVEISIISDVRHGMEFVTTEMTILSKVLGARVHIRLTKQIMGIFGDLDYRYAK